MAVSESVWYSVEKLSEKLSGMTVIKVTVDGKPSTVAEVVRIVREATGSGCLMELEAREGFCALSLWHNGHKGFPDILIQTEPDPIYQGTLEMERARQRAAMIERDFYLYGFKR